MRLLPKNISHVIKVQTCLLSIRWTSPKSVSAPSDFNKLILVALIDELIKLYYFFCKLYDFWCKNDVEKIEECPKKSNFRTLTFFLLIIN